MKKFAVLGGVLVVALVSGGVWWKSRAVPEAGAAAAPKPAQVVTLFTVQRRDMPVVLEQPALVQPIHSVEIRPQISGTLRSVAVREGQVVRKGELLFVLDDRAEQANLDKARAQLLRDRVSLADLERQQRRAQELRAQNFIAPSAMDAVSAQVDSQRAALALDEAALKSAEVALSLSTLRAPLSGRVGQVTVNPGSLVTPSGAALLTIHQIDPIGVSFTLPENQLAPLLASGAADAAQKVAVAVLLPAAGPQRGAQAPARETLEGVLSFIDNAVDSATGTLRLKGELPNPRQQLWPGQAVTVRLTLRTLKDASVLPQAALILRGQERLVYVVNAAMQAELRPVQPRFASGEFIAVEGVQPGERVVVEGKQNLRPGATVREAAAGPRPAASAASAAAPGASQ